MAEQNYLDLVGGCLFKKDDGFVNLNDGTIGSMRAQLTTNGQLRFICAGIGQSGASVYARIFPTDYVVKNYKESA